MHLAHFYDHTYYRHDGRHYSSGAFNRASWQRYLNGGFERLTVVGNLGRTEPAQLDQLNAVDHPSVDFQFVPNARQPGHYLRYAGGRYEALLTELIAAHAAIVVRLPSELGLFALRTARRLGKPYAIEVVGCTWDAYWNHGSLKGKIMAPISFRRMRRAIREAPYTIYVTEHFLQQRYPTDGYATHASNVDITVADGNEVLDRRLARISQQSGPLQIGLIGSSNVRYKGHREAILALGQLKTAAFELHFVGPGDRQWTDRLADKAGIGARVHQHGKLPAGPPIIDFLDGLDLYLHPSRQEGLPRTVIEAMSRGLPVLASSIAGIPELLPARYLHEPGHVRQLTEHLRAYLSAAPSDRAAMAKENYARARDYDRRILQQRRNDFWLTFAHYAAQR